MWKGLLIAIILFSSCAKKKPTSLIGKWQVVRHVGNSESYEFNPNVDKKKIYIWFKNDSIYELRNEFADTKSLIQYQHRGDTIYITLPDKNIKKTIVKFEADKAFFKDGDKQAVLQRVKEK